ncbi:Magnesium transporter MRS2/LPE10 [Macleaya cordata]|uniref:Magnesium transporter MRS2/LPE10 n=1 Tax=Macleaya cordata TaxID=56857 RepID=A0A200Q1Y0_MACCD|nr:Magnesium transporter MRS2/LPE10 [Macleaya cordata]
MDRGTTTSTAPLPQPPPQARRKGGGAGGGGIIRRTWLVVSGSSGKSHVEEVGKNPIMRRTGLPARDLRILDPILSYPSTILGRERAIVVNLEHIKAIITATEVLVLNFKDPAVVPFVRDLEDKVSANSIRPHPPHAAATGESPKFSVTNHEKASHQLHNSSSQNPNDDDIVQILGDGSGSPKDVLDVPKFGGPKVLPFEFKALEVCLESVCRCLETEG